MKVTGKTFRDVADEIRKLTGVETRSSIRFRAEGPSPEEQARNRVWRGAGTVTADSPVGLYLTGRVGRLWPSNAIRAGKIWNAEVGQKLDCMVSEITGKDGQQVNLHLTFVSPDGRKADIPTVKRVMPGTLPEGSAIRIWPAAKRMGIAEGIENAMSAAMLYKLPVWSAVSGAMLAKWTPPDEAEEILIFADHDSNFTGQAKAYQLANRLVVQFKRKVKVMMPPLPDEDWNDHLRGLQRPK